MSFVPTRVFFTKGVGRHKEQLSSFELALREAKIAATNIVTVSSILPPRCKRISIEEGLKALSPGQIIFTVMARNGTDFGIQLSALPGRWFVAPSPMVEGLYVVCFTVGWDYDR